MIRRRRRGPVSVTGQVLSALGRLVDELERALMSVQMAKIPLDHIRRVRGRVGTVSTRCASWSGREQRRAASAGPSTGTARSSLIANIIMGAISIQRGRSIHRDAIAEIEKACAMVEMPHALRQSVAHWKSRICRAIEPARSEGGSVRA